MHLATFSRSGAPRIGIESGGGIIDVARRDPTLPSTVIELIGHWGEYSARMLQLARAAPDVDLAEVRLHAPVPHPRKILAIGLNYADHIAESRIPMPTVQTWFAKMPTSVCGPFDSIELPCVSEQLDYECELVLFIGKRCRNVSSSRAREVIFGYCVGNDVCVRDWQFASSQWTLGKSFDTHAPMGPWLTTADEIDPHALDIQLCVNEDVRQSSNTQNLIFDCFAQIEHLSKAMTLEPGDALFTGTCGGVGFARKPPLWLKAGDLVRVDISGLGRIENRVVNGPVGPSGY